MILETGKTYHDSEGNKVRVLVTDMNNGCAFNCAALVTNRRTGEEGIRTYRCNGKFAETGDHPNDLHDVPKEGVGWANVCITPDGRVSISAYNSKQEAEEARIMPGRTERVSLVRFCWTQGVFDD